MGELKNTDYVMNNSFWIGVYPGLDKEKLSFMTTKIQNFVKSYGWNIVGSFGNYSVYSTQNKFVI